MRREFRLTGEISGRQEYDLVSNCPSTNTSEKMTLRFDQAWNLVLMAIALLALATPARAESDSKKDRAEDACTAAAMSDYVKANNALVQQTATVMSVETTIAQRRLQEEYCLRFVRCSLDDPHSATFRVQFDSCLKDEALDKYEAIPRDGNEPRH